MLMNRTYNYVRKCKYIRTLAYNSNVHLRYHQSSPVDKILSQLNSVYILTIHFQVLTSVSSSMGQNHPWRSMSVSQLRNAPPFMKLPRFTAVLTATTPHSILRQINKAHFFKPYSKIHLNIILLHKPRLQILYADPTHMILVILWPQIIF